MNNHSCKANPVPAVRRLPGFWHRVCICPAILLASCAPAADIVGPPFQIDLLPPQLIAAEALDGYSVQFTFDEPVRQDETGIRIDPPISIGSVTALETVLRVEFSEQQQIGRLYTMRAGVSDGSGNSLSFLYEFSGWNPRIPEILINEVNPRGSGNTPDCIELVAGSSGNLGGLCLRIGTESEYSDEKLFPDVEISEGEFIVIHARPEGLAGEVDETGGTDESIGLLALDTARDFWMTGEAGLPGNNGAVTLLARRHGPVLDAVIWSDRADDPDDESLGWTSEGLAFAADLAASGAWHGSAAGGVPYPSEAVDVSMSTATRSLCRSSIPQDSDSRADWHTVPTRGQTFGLPNSNEVYSP